MLSSGGKKVVLVSGLTALLVAIIWVFHNQNGDSTQSRTRSNPESSNQVSQSGANHPSDSHAMVENVTQDSDLTSAANALSATGTQTAEVAPGNVSTDPVSASNTVAGNPSEAAKAEGASSGADSSVQANAGVSVASQSGSNKAVSRSTAGQVNTQPQQVQNPIAPGANSQRAIASPSNPLASGQDSIQVKAEKALEIPKIMDGCFTVTFKHKKISSHSDGEACLSHKNLIVLNHPDQDSHSKINLKSVCVRVNGSAVNFTQVKNHPNQIVIGPEAGPNAKITARYCIGKSNCSEDCTIKKDEFLSALGAEGQDSSESVDWDGTRGSAKETAELENEMSKLNSQVEGSGKGEKTSIFDGWQSDSHTMACGHKNSNDKSIAQVSSR